MKKQSKTSEKKSNLSIPQKSVSPDVFVAVNRAGIKIYPVCYEKKWYIEVDNNNEIKRWPKEVEYKEIQNALAATQQYYFNKLNALKTKMP